MRGAGRHVPDALDVGVHEGGVAAPVLGRRVGQDELRQLALRLEAREQRAALAGHRIDRGDVGEREQASDRAGGVQRRLTEALVELAAAGAGDVRHHAVEDRAPRLVLVQAEVEEVAEEPPGLRHAQDVGALELGRAGVALGGGREAEPGGRVAHGDEAEADEGRLLGAVDQLVDLPGLEAAVEAHVGRVGEPPRRARDRGGGSAGVLANRQAGRRVVEIGRGVPDVVAVGEGQRGDAAVRPPLAQERARDRAGVTAGRRHREGHEAVLARDVVLPAAPRHRVAVAHEKAVAEILGRRRIGHAHRAVEHPERHLAAAVGHVEEEPAVAARGVPRPQHVEVRFALDQTRRVARGQGEIGDGLVRRVSRVDADAEDPRDLLVGARVTEGAAVEHRRTLCDPERCHGHRIDSSCGRVSAAASRGRRRHRSACRPDSSRRSRWRAAGRRG